jgi:hypothetical protein
MKELLEQLDNIEAIVDTVNPKQIEENPSGVASCYEIYANSYDPLQKVKTLRNHLIETLEQGDSVNGYLSADYGYGKTATLIYLWYECQKRQIVAVPKKGFPTLRIKIRTNGNKNSFLRTVLVVRVERLPSFKKSG